jgi:hypothetical protein
MPVGGDSDTLSAFVKSQIQLWRKAITDAGLAPK